MRPRNNKRPTPLGGRDDVTLHNLQKGVPTNPKRKRLDSATTATRQPTVSSSFSAVSSESKHAGAKKPIARDFNLYDALRDLKKDERNELDGIFNNPLPRNEEATQAAATVRALLRSVRNKRLASANAVSTTGSQSMEPAFEEAIAVSALPSQNLRSRPFRGPAVSRTPWARWIRFKCGDSSIDSVLTWNGSTPCRPPVSSLCQWWSEQPFTWRLHHEISAFACWAELTSYEIRRRQEVLARVHFIAKTLWPECEMVPFGSFVTGLCLPDGDMDICICNVPCSKPADAVQTLARALKRSRFTRQISPITKARIPIVKYVDASFGLHVDISINQESSADTTNLVRDKLVEWPQMRPLILILKETLRQWELGETYRGGIGSYLLFCMTLHHLQHTENLKSKNLGELLIGFLSRYSYFDYYLDGIDVRGSGRLIVKADMRDGGPVDGLLCVASPLEPKTDCGRNSYKIDVVVERLKRRLDRLQSVEMAEKQAAEMRDIDLLRDIRESSLLSAVISCEEKSFEARRVPSNHPDVGNFSIYRSRSQTSIPDQVFEDVFRRLSSTLGRILEPYGNHRAYYMLESSRPSLLAISQAATIPGTNNVCHTVPRPPSYSQPSNFVSHVIHASHEIPANRVVSIPDDSDDDEGVSNGVKNHLQTLNRTKTQVDRWH
eukprot:Gregarina_sp_Poly_1__268@NODE_1065_length_5196_cov_51_378826_g740_i0_p2_GENE_NODE_1065_length_5196_cov_51_378826_g740_i0NODE_1065_length_5196_cov_51_378826_g740_i0_p2_ORF_typecomplete_len665_score68_92NTP_transf_2/PF01909_23/4_3e14NTP_transf_2/PF01909_23/1_6e04PAP_assoc/PF03828_19/2_4e07_NODE_1065_length_5196_cov_51_378826_g740_i031395133